MINMTKIIVFADVHGEFEKLSKMIDKINDRDFDAVICPGDFTDMYNIPEGYSQMDIAEIIVQKLMSFGKPVFCVPGNHEPYDILDVFDEYDVNVHMNHKKMGNFDIIGFGGAATPFNTKFEPTEEEIKNGLECAAKHVKGKFILITHNPPYNTDLDKTESGEHVGSKNVREFIEKNKPVLALSAHIHEAGGTGKIGGSVLFYPGAVYEGYYGMITIDDEVKCEIRKIDAK
jgi:Icc-related predicted phosphoesterase